MAELGEKQPRSPAGDMTVSQQHGHAHVMRLWLDGKGVDHETTQMPLDDLGISPG
jgi:hypothetical protein